MQDAEIEILPCLGLLCALSKPGDLPEERRRKDVFQRRKILLMTFTWGHHVVGDPACEA